MESTLLIIKPDAVKKRVIGKIISMIEASPLRIEDMKMDHFSRKRAEEFYAVHRGKPFYRNLVEFMTSGSIIAIKLSGENAVEILREIIGVTDPSKAGEGTIRKLYGTDIQKNAVHASDSLENAKKEIPFFFEGENG